MTARAVRFTAPRKVGVEPVPLPGPGPDELVVRTLFSGISAGTEMLAYRGELDASTVLDESLGSLRGTFAYPFGFGYSCVGRVERGTSAVPTDSLVFAFHPHQDRFVVPAAEAVPLPAGTDPRTATLYPLVETALQLTLDSGARMGEPAVVTGLGPVGLLTALLLARSGVHVLAAEPQEWRRGVAAGLGLATTAPAELPARVAGLTGGAGVPLVVEASGTPAALAGALDLLAHEGTVLVGSWYGSSPVPLPLGGPFHRRRLTIRSSQVSTIPAAAQAVWNRDRRRATARDLLADLPLEKLPLGEHAFGDAATAYADIDRGLTGVLHTALRYE